MYRSLQSIVITFIFLSCPAILNAWSEHESYIRRFVGQWKGVYTVTSLFGKDLGSYPMEQSYYWMDGHLMGATAIRLPDGKPQYEYSEVWCEGPILKSIVESDHNRREYYGWMAMRKIWWQSNYNSRASIQQLHTESLEPTLSGFQLTMDGHQWSAGVTASNFMRIYAKLDRLTPGETFEMLESMPE